MLEMRGVSAGYGLKSVLHDVSIQIRSGEFVTIVGANTAGKSTLLRCISRLVESTGEIKFDGLDLRALPPHRIASLGIAHVPEGRHVFPEMSVEDNLLLGIYPNRSKSDVYGGLSRIYEMFPRLAERRRQFAGTLSGGEQQMVALGRALILEPKLLILDEPSHGLAPKIVDELHHRLVGIHKSGVSMLLVEQNVALALSVAQRGYVLESGRVVLEGEASTLANNEDVRLAYLGL
jgi:branched-chain amino acid transport system ATP-binding protein